MKKSLLLLCILILTTFTPIGSMANALDIPFRESVSKQSSDWKRFNYLDDFLCQKQMQNEELLLTPTEKHSYCINDFRLSSNSIKEKTMFNNQEYINF